MFLSRPALEEVLLPPHEIKTRVSNEPKTPNFLKLEFDDMRMVAPYGFSVSDDLTRVTIHKDMLLFQELDEKDLI